VGSVSNIKISDDTTGNVEVTLRLNADVQKFISTDTKASIETEGLVGNKVVILKIGTSGDPVQSGDVIQTAETPGFAAIIEETQGILGYTKELTSNLAEIVAKVNSGEGSVGKLINKDDLYRNTNNLIISADRSLSAITMKMDTLANIVNSLGFGVQAMIANVDGVVIGIDTIISNIQKGEGVLGVLVSKESQLSSNLTQVLDNIIQITEDTKLGTARFAENMEAMKRNWLFKSYFEERGFYDKPGYEKKLDEYMNEINSRIKTLDNRIETLRKLGEKFEKK
jgi:phospholipid/cholesterol/gamma-HCH transport system substrate-binding protein